MVIVEPAPPDTSTVSAPLPTLMTLCVPATMSYVPLALPIVVFVGITVSGNHDSKNGSARSTSKIRIEWMLAWRAAAAQDERVPSEQRPQGDESARISAVYIG
jgi:hypothetical protein